jgi:hypothetical protein
MEVDRFKHRHHQIKMKESDQLATSFITPFGMYCYITM